MQAIGLIPEQALDDPSAVNNLILDGINNNWERTINWANKETYRTMSGYECDQSVLNVNRLNAFAVDQNSQGLNLANLIA